MFPYIWTSWVARQDAKNNSRRNLGVQGGKMLLNTEYLQKKGGMKIWTTETA
jgi:hypothetical protein